MIEINPSTWRSPKPFAHQVVGVKALVKNPAFFLGDAPRTCKSRQVVDAACILREAGLIDMVLVVSPVAGRAVWGDKELGQIKLYSWKRVRVHQFHANPKDLWSDEDPEMLWVVTNYDILRKRVHLDALCTEISDKKMLLVLDESSAVGNHNSQQSNAVAQLRVLAKRCVMLNGTPGEPPKLWSQFNILDARALKRYKNFTTFRWSYAEWGKPKRIIAAPTNGKKGGPRIVHDQIGWKNLEKLSRILSPWCLRRERKDCPELKSIRTMYDLKEVLLSEESWRMYQQLKREALIELESGGIYVSANAAVRLMRLSQMTSGHLGGFEAGEKTQNLSSEKLDWTVAHLRDVCTARNMIVWCRWARERERLAEMLEHIPGFQVHQLYGDQKRESRREAEMVFTDGIVRGDRSLRHVMIAQPQAGGMALDFSAASEVFRLSNDYSLKTLEQSDDRPLGPAQQADTVMYTDVLATGPDGQRTIDHIVVAALREKKNLARLTTSEWRKELEE